MTKITVYFDRAHPDVEYKLIGVTNNRDVVLADTRRKNVDHIVAEFPSGSWIKYLTYWTAYTKWKTQWVQRLVTEDLEYGAIPPKPWAQALDTSLDLQNEADSLIRKGGDENLRAAYSKLADAAAKMSEFLRLGGTRDEYDKQMSAIVNLRERIPSLPPAPSAPPGLVETTQLWVDMGYSPAEANLIALWSIENQASPGFWQIQEIIRLGGLPKPSEPPQETALQREWREFFAHPDVITALGLTPGSVQESFSLVFSNYSIINAREQSPETGDYASVYLILAGLTLLASTGLYAVLSALPSVGIGGMMKGSTAISSSVGAAALKKAAAQLASVVPGSKVAALASKLVASPWFAIITVANLAVLNAWNFTDPMWWWGAEVKMTGDTKRRFESLRIDVNKKLQQAYALVYIDPDATKLASARTLLRATKPLITQMFNLLTGLEIDKSIKEKYPEFVTSVEASVSQYNDLVVAAGGIEDDYLILEGLMAPPAELPMTFPKEFDLEDVQVIDGDGLAFPGHPEVKNEIRILGIDAHEIETAAGKVEAEYLKSLIENKTVTLKVHQYSDPERTIGLYGRLLAGVFLGDQDIALAMLEHFGKALMVKSTYRKKYRWIDWDEYKRVAEAAVGPEVKEFKIYIDSTPSNAKLYIDGVYTHHLTPSDEKELKDVMDLLEPGKHVIMASKAGLEGSAEVVILEGANPPIALTLQVIGLEPVEPAPAEPPVEPPAEVFKINVLSSPSRAKLFIDDEYTHHLTPSNEAELKDVMHLLTPGAHTFKVTKAGMVAEKVVEVVPGVNEPIYFTLEVVGLPRTREQINEEIFELEKKISELKAELEKL